jgi:hypothetical protein
MSIWVNADGLSVKFPAAQGDVSKGGAHAIVDSGLQELEFIVDYTDLLSATAAILGSAVASTDGSLGVMFPEGAIAEEVELVVLTAFTSSGTIGSATLEIGTIKASDRTTALDADAFTTTSVVGSVLDAVGEKTVIRVGSTGAGSALGVANTENGVIAVRNSAHASHPYTAGKLKVRVKYTFLS